MQESPWLNFLTQAFFNDSGLQVHPSHKVEHICSVVTSGTQHCKQSS